METAPDPEGLTLHALRRGLDRCPFESELEQPRAGGRLSISLRSRELPSLGRLEGLIREVLAGASGPECSSSDFSGRVHLYPYDYFDRAPDRVLGTPGNFRNNLANDFAA